MGRESRHEWFAVIVEWRPGCIVLPLLLTVCFDGAVGKRKASEMIRDIKQLELMLQG